MVRCDALTRPTTWEDYASLRPRTGRSQASETRWFVSSCVRRSAVGGGARHGDIYISFFRRHVRWWTP
eukprot:scaffold18881_cov30-Phaeocystis_antarctica.AAC.2